MPEEGEIIPSPIQNNVEALSAFTNDQHILDATQRLKFDHTGTVIFNFGKYMGRPAAEVLYNDQQYYHWMLNKEFSHQVKKIIQRLVSDYKKKLQDC